MGITTYVAGVNGFVGACYWLVPEAVRIRMYGTVIYINPRVTASSAGAIGPNHCAKQ